MKKKIVIQFMAILMILLGLNSSVCMAQTVSYPKVTTLPISSDNITLTTAKINGEVTSDGGDSSTIRGVCWNSYGTPMLERNDPYKEAAGNGAGLFTVEITGLTPNKTYYVRTYATNSRSRVYGGELSFKTKTDRPVVTTSNITAIGSTNAVSGGEVTSDNGASVTVRGICWSISANPTITQPDPFVKGEWGITKDGSGLGKFTSSVTGLSRGITYYLRAYATNSVGTGYGAEKSFITLNTPVVITESAAFINKTTVSAEGNVTDNGGHPITARGFCWGISANPTLNPPETYAKGEWGTTPFSTVGTGSFTASITGLLPGKQYYISAYSANSVGTSYGNPILVSPRVIYVKKDATGSNNDGTSWQNAFTSLQDALNSASEGDDIWVAGGTYTPSTNRYGTFQLKNNIEIYGGFDGTESNRDDRKPGNPSVLSGDIGVKDDLSDNVFHVVTGSYTDSTAVLDGFTITKGNANGSDPDDRGGGLFIDNGSPAISNCTFIENRATLGGGGIFNASQSSPLITRCTFTQNKANIGGGICNISANPVIINTTFYQNTASYGGGGMYSDIGDIVMTNCTVSSNITDSNNSGIGFGGGIYVESDATFITIKNTLIADNKKGTISPKADDCYNEDGIIDSAGYNLVENGCASWFDNTGDITGEQTALNLNPLADNGGFTQTCGLSADSAAIDAGNDIDAPDKDQRGFARNGATDIGAFEFIGPRLTTTAPSDISYNSAISGGEMIEDNGSPITAKGVCWSTSEHPLTTQGQGVTDDETGSEDFTSSVTGLTPGTRYYLRAFAVNQDGISYGNELSFKTVPATPIVNSATGIKATEFAARWYSAAGADTYHLDLSVSSDFKTFVTGYEDKNVGKVITYTITGLTSGNTYYYRVRAVNDGGASENSEIMTVVTIPPAPGILPASNVTSGGFIANWSETAGAEDYRLDVSSSKTFTAYLTGYRDLSVGKGTSRQVTGLTSGNTYYYRVRAVNTSGTSGNSEIQTVITIAQATSANAATNISATGFTANWKAVTGAESYRLDVSLTEEFATFIKGYNDKTVSGTNEIITGLTGGTIYYYRVRVVNAGGSSDNSNVIKVLTFPPAPKIAPASDIYANRFTAHWEASASAESYILDVSALKDFSAFITGYKNKIITVLSDEVTGLTGNTTYYYAVRAMNESGVSERSEIQEVKTGLSAPKAIKASEISAAGFTANWESLAGADHYYLDISTVNDFASFVAGYENLLIAGVSKSITGLTPGTLYYYRVRAANTTGTSENSNTIETITVPPAPVPAPASDIHSSGFTAQWEEAVGAESYLLDISMEPDFSTYIKNYENLSVTGISQIITGLVPATSYYYRIRAVNAGGISQNSSPVANVTTAPPAPVITEATEITETGFVANWNPTPTAKSYRIDISPMSDFSEYVKSYEDLSVNETNQRVIGLTPGTTYYYRVRAVSSNGISVNSDTGTVKTLSIAPTVVTTGVSSVMATTAIIGGEITHNGGADIISRGICWSKSENPTITTGVNVQDTSSGIGVFTIALTGLNSRTTYYVRAYSENQVGVGYGEQKSFKTLGVPIVTTAAITNITAVSASGGGNVTDNGGAAVTARGICWSTSSEPGLDNGAICSSQGTGLGSFTVSITGLSSHNTYYVRAYSVNIVGTGYGEERSFSTTSTSTVITADVSNITSTTASGGGTVTDKGGASVTERGICWGTFSEPDLENGAICSSDGAGEGSFTHSITGLTPDTTYYIRAYASNSIGKSYGDEVSFKTLVDPGDINADGKVNLADAILALKLLSGIEPGVAIHSDADADNDGKISLGDVIYILRKSSGL